MSVGFSLGLSPFRVQQLELRPLRLPAFPFESSVFYRRHQASVGHSFGLPFGISGVDVGWPCGPKVQPSQQGGTFDFALEAFDLSDPFLFIVVFDEIVFVTLTSDRFVSSQPFGRVLR